MLAKIWTQNCLFFELFIDILIYFLLGNSAESYKTVIYHSFFLTQTKEEDSKGTKY